MATTECKCIQKKAYRENTNQANCNDIKTEEKKTHFENMMKSLKQTEHCVFF